MGKYPKMDPPHIKSSCGTQNKNSNPMVIGLGMNYVTAGNIQKLILTHIKSSFGTHNKNSNPMDIGLGIDFVAWKHPKMDPPHIKSSCGTQSKNSNPMGIGLGIDYVTWGNIQKRMPRTLNLHRGHKMKIPILWVQG